MLHHGFHVLIMYIYVYLMLCCAFGHSAPPPKKRLMLHLHIMFLKSNMRYLPTEFVLCSSIFFLYFEKNVIRSWRVCFDEKHVHLNWLNSIGDHQPKSNRCKLNKPEKNINKWQKCFHLKHLFESWPHTVMNSIFNLLYEICSCVHSLHRFMLVRPFNKKHIYSTLKDTLTLACMKGVSGNWINGMAAAAAEKKGRERTREKIEWQK